MQFLSNPLAERAQKGELRHLKDINIMPESRVILQGQACINFSSNDYLGLSEHPLLQKRAIAFMQRFGAGSKASRLVTGNHQGFVEVEEKLAQLKGVEAALIFNSGFQLNSSVIPLIAGPKSLILMDRLIHNSMIQGALLGKASSGSTKIQRFRHNDLAHLQELLENNQGKFDRILILVESVYSMDGDRADVWALQELADRHQAILMVDEAHATGVLGEEGMGLCATNSATNHSGKKIDLIMGTFGKAMGSFGAYLACSKQMKEYIVNFCNGFIYTTALPPQVLGAIDAALDLVPTMQKERLELQEKAAAFRRELQEAGFSTLDSSTQIVPVLLGESTKAVGCAEYLQSKGLLAIAIRPPTVEENKARLRVAINLKHSLAEITELVEEIQNYANRK